MDGDLIWVLGLRTDYLTQFFKIFPYFASYYFFFITIALGYWSSAKHKIFWLDLGFMVTLSAILNRILKEVFAVDRPNIERLVQISDDSYSFPSGDAQVLAVFWLMLAYHMRSYIIWFVAIAIIILVSISRVYLGAHFPADVTVGSLVGYLCFIAYIKFGKNRMAALIKDTNPILQLLALLTICLFYYLILHKHFGKIDLVTIGTLLGSWFGYLLLPKAICNEPLRFGSILIGVLTTTLVILALKQLLLSFPGIYMLELSCYVSLAFFFIYLVPVLTKRFSSFS